MTAPRSAHVAAGIELLGQAEVGDLGRAVGAEQHVGRLQIAMNHAAQMRVVHGPCQPLDEVRRFLRRESLAFQLAVETTAVAELQREERQAVVLADVVKLNDIGVLQAGDGLRLDLEAHLLLQRGVGSREDHLESDDSIGLDLPCLVHDAHAAVTEFAEDLVPRNDQPRRAFEGEDRGTRTAGQHGAVG